MVTLVCQLGIFPLMPIPLQGVCVAHCLLIPVSKGQVVRRTQQRLCVFLNNPTVLSLFLLLLFFIVVIMIIMFILITFALSSLKFGPVRWYDISLDAVLITYGNL